MVIDEGKTIRLDNISEDFIAARNISLQLLRLDELHPEISGNKWFKLKNNLQAARKTHHHSLLTFGGAHSNHLAATAAAAKQYGLQAIGMVRGLHGQASASPTLDFCRQQGMVLSFLSREEYALKDNPDFLAKLGQQFNHPYIIPEGGNNTAGRLGCADIARHIPSDAQYVAVPVGTGTTFAGLRNALPPATYMLGFAPMKKGDYLNQELAQYLTTDHNWHISDEFHFGGFGKYNDELIAFMNAFYDTYRIPLDFVYTAKMIAGIYQLIHQGYFPDGTTIVALHTGGLQGNRSIAHKLRQAHS